MALTDDEKQLLERLTAKQNEKDDDDFDVEIWDEKGAGARVPYRKGKTFLQRFGIDVEPPAKDDKPEPDKDKPGAATRYFGGKGQGQGKPQQ
jgi:hypothetical protein